MAKAKQDISDAPQQELAEAAASTPAASEQPAEDARRYAVLSPIRMDGVDYAPGATIALSAAQHEQLRLSGAIDPEPLAAPEA